MNILVVMKNWLGDTLFQIPALQAIRDYYPKERITCLLPPRCHDILKYHPALDEMLAFDERELQKSWNSRIQFAFNLRKEQHKAAYIFHPSATRAALMWMAGAKERVGYQKGRKWLLTKAVCEPRAPLHHVDYFLNLVKESGISVPEKGIYRMVLHDSEKDLSRVFQQIDFSKPYICFHLGANWAPKAWPPSYFAELADWIESKYQMPIVVTGATKDLALFENFKSCLQKARIYPLVGKTTLRQLAALYEKCFMMVSSDSGPMHIASSVGSKVVALFGPTDPELTGPRGWGKKMVLSYVPAGASRPYITQDEQSDTLLQNWMYGLKPEQVANAIEENRWSA